MICITSFSLFTVAVLTTWHVFHSGDISIERLEMTQNAGCYSLGRVLWDRWWLPGQQDVACTSGQLKRGTKICNGQADGLQCRSVGILAFFSFVDKVWKESNDTLEINLWKSDRAGRI